MSDDKTKHHVRGTFLTNEEHELIAKLGSLAADFSSIVDTDITRDADMREIVFHIHALQHTVMAQAAARAYPDLYRRLGSRIPNPFLGVP